MQELINKYKLWYYHTPREWKLAIIEKAKSDGVMHINNHQDLDWLYDDCVDYLTDKTPRRIQNLAKKMGYKRIPCYVCRKMIEYWNHNDEWKWSPDKSYLFGKYNIKKDTFIDLLYEDAKRDGHSLIEMGDKVIHKMRNSDNVTVNIQDLLELRSYIPLRFLEEYDKNKLTSLEKKSGLVEAVDCKII